MEPAAIVAVFDSCFAGPGAADEDRARLVRGGEEPLVLPAGRGRPIAEVVYARDLAPSCLHETAHWLIAGPARRRLVDYGYWYVPDGRDALAQERFERAEVAVQALEALLAEAAGIPFSLSADNLAAAGPSRAFAAAVAASSAQRRTRLTARMRLFFAALRRAAATSWS